jgi:hypothetical protein
VKKRPAAGRAPSTEKKSSVTISAQTMSADELPAACGATRFTGAPVIAASPANAPLRSRKST